MRILVVGDDASIDGGLKRGLHKEGFAVVTFSKRKTLSIAMRVVLPEPSE
jgi:DNA-binding response OmpR family regulator